MPKATQLIVVRAGIRTQSDLDWALSRILSHLPGARERTQVLNTQTAIRQIPKVSLLRLHFGKRLIRKTPLSFPQYPKLMTLSHATQSCEPSGLTNTVLLISTKDGFCCLMTRHIILFLKDCLPFDFYLIWGLVDNGGKNLLFGGA